MHIFLVQTFLFSSFEEEIRKYLALATPNLGVGFWTKLLFVQQGSGPLLDS